MSTLFAFNVPAYAFQCGNISLPNNQARTLLDNLIPKNKMKINRRKSLRILDVESVSGTQCNANIKLKVKLYRKFRRDAKGTIKLKGKTVIKGDKFCLNNIHVSSVKLSHTANIGERWLRNAMNRKLKNICF